MPLEEEFGDLFNNRDLNGNEPDEPDTSDSDSDLESNDAETDFGEDEETVEEDKEQLDEVPLSFLAQKVKHILEEMDRIYLNLADFLDVLSWGDVANTQDPKIRVKRTILLGNPKLHSILNRWAHPPRLPRSKKKRPEGATTVMRGFTLQFMKEEISRGLEKLAPYLVSPVSDDVRTATLISTGFDELSEKMKSETPLLWSLLKALTQHPKPRKPRRKDPKKVCSKFIMIQPARKEKSPGYYYHNCYAFIHAVSPPLSSAEAPGPLFPVQGNIGQRI